MVLTGLGKLISLLSGSGPAHSLGRPEPAQANHWDTLLLILRLMEASAESGL